ncbi:MAG: hypothetical protein ACI8P9_004224 [Parasphingorhabdus sp.]|jgi:hypothetical protein
MPTKRLSMRHLREILRLRLHGGLSVRQIHSSLRVSVGGVQKVIKKAQEQSLDWDSVNQLNDRQLASLFYPQADTRAAPCHELPDWVTVHQELKRKGNQITLVGGIHRAVP